MSARTPRTMGVEEEFHLVDAKTRRLAPRAPELLRQLPEDYVAELQRCVIEINTGISNSLAELRADLQARRAVLVDAAQKLGLGVVAAGAVPLSVPAEMLVTPTARYRRMLADYQLLAREQLICGTQVHVGVEDRDEAVAVASRVAPDLPTLLALSASSPFWADGADTGYSSARTLIWQRWPTTGLAAPVDNAADYDRLVDDLVSSGVITDVGMVYFDVRPSNSAPTVELRVCDSCPLVDTIVLVAGLFRALVTRELDAHRAGKPPRTLSPPLGRAALWRAARSGTEGDLVDLNGPTSEPAPKVIWQLIESVRPQLEEAGDWETVTELARRALLVGTSAARQRRALRRRGRLIDVVDQLIAETAGNAPATTFATDKKSTLLAGYGPPVVDDTAGYDEAVDTDGSPRSEYATILDAVARLDIPTLRERQSNIEHQQRAEGINFRVSGQNRPQVFPIDLVPRLISADEWTFLSEGLAQRAKALDHFLRDVYTDQAIVSDGIVPLHAIDLASRFRSTGRLVGHALRAHIAGIDLVCDGPGQWYVLEDNLRVPSGVAYAMANRRLLREFIPELNLPTDIEAVEHVPQMLLETLRAAAPPHADGELDIALLTSGWEDSAWYEHSYLADQMGITTVRPSDLSTRDGKLFRHNNFGNVVQVDVVYARMDEDMLLSSNDHTGTPLSRGIREALVSKNLSIVNALGNGVADDKAIYAYVPAMIEYYLNEKPRLPQIRTWICAEREQRDYVIANLDKLVVKPVDGLGGRGILIGPDATDIAIEERRRELLSQPERYVAQELVALSTHPTFDGDGLYPQRVDLRAFVHLRPGQSGPEAQVVPAALTRVAARGSHIVNSTSGGGSKDTWIMTGKE
ncbi:MAG: carboxylate--amine ligase/circularly permuted type 2 ATP-grasp protein [Nocardiaceae bacterium]|nr:carboxylate--amine ligase/circularly permuted type 2 ATP-grasp protein [Nocardiaceae bacterium]